MEHQSPNKNLSSKKDMVEISNIVLTSVIAIASFLILITLLSPIVLWFKQKKCTSNDSPEPPSPPDCVCASSGDNCGNTPALKLLSRGKPVTISPAWQSYPGSNLTDGDYGTFAHSADWISTSDVSAEIDLGQSYIIRKVKIFNRQDCCQDRFGYHKLVIDDKQVGDGDAKGAWEYDYCLNLQGQRIKIVMDGVLNLGEIEVWGY